MKPSFTCDDILDLVGPVLFERGLSYYHRGMVEKIGWDGTTLRGTVRGVSEPYYEVAVRFTEPGWETGCTCPYDDVVCKHVAALMLAALEDKSVLRNEQSPRAQEEASPLTEAQVRSFIFNMPKKDLADTLWSLAQADSDLYNSLMLKASAARGEKASLVEFRQQIRSALSPQDYVEYREVPSYTHHLEMVAEGLRELTDRGQPREAAELLKTLIDGCVKRMEDLDDSDGVFSGFVRSLFDMWGEFLAQVPNLGRQELAHMVLERLEGDEYGLADELIAAMAKALGKEGLDKLEGLIRSKYELQRHKEMARAKGSSSFNHSLWLYRRALKDIADVRGDVDGYIALCEEDTPVPADCLEMASRLQKAGRLSEALAMAERGRSLSQGDHGYAIPQLSELRIQLLVEMGLNERALGAVWDYFRESPCLRTYHLILAHTPEDKRQSAREEALDCALTQARLSSAIEICQREGELPALVQTLATRQEELLRLDYHILAPLANDLESGYPELAILIYRKLALDILEQKHSPAYYHAVDYLHRVKRLFTRLGQDPEWKSLRDEIKANHRRKRSFMPLFEKL